MCGIAGVFGWTDQGTLDDMLDSIKHRGPDGQGTFVRPENDLMMGARRLAIIDLEGGEQPIANEKRDVHVVFNGEIYNYPELRSSLDSEGHRFRTDCDTEVLVHLWEEYGRSMVERLDGMFAFSLWDQTREELFIVRDRLGIKPLFYANGDDGFVWGSEIASLLKADIDPVVDEKSLYNFLSLKYTPWPQTLLEGVRKVPPGTALSVTEDGVSEDRYWRLPTKEVHGSTTSLTNRIRELLERSVERRLMADVPVGAFLSGGIDSSAIVGMMADRVDNLKTFSIGFESEQYDESGEARTVADHYGTDHHEVTVDLSSMDTFPKMVRHYGEPLADPAVLPTMILSKLAGDHLKVVLSGTGADELFAGYEYYRKFPRHRRKYGRIPLPILRAIKRLAPFAPPKQTPLGDVFGSRHVSYLGSLGTDREGFQSWTRMFDRPPETYIDTVYNSATSGLDDRIESTFARVDNDDIVKKMATFDLTYWLPDDLLYKTDHASMSASLEVRVPFLDRELVELAYNIPSEFMGVDDFKPLLKRAVHDLLPRPILERGKHGLTVPTEQWFREDHEAINGVLTEEAVARAPYINEDVVFSIWDAHQRGKTNNMRTLWKVLNYVAWHEEFCC